MCVYKFSNNDSFNMQQYNCKNNALFYMYVQLCRHQRKYHHAKIIVELLIA